MTLGLSMQIGDMGPIKFEKMIEEPPNIQLIIRCFIHQRIQDRTPSFDKAINEVF